MADALLEVRNLGAFHGASQALFDIGFIIARGEAAALLGRNGAGKSTTFKAILGLIERRAEKIAFDGRDLTKLQPYEAARLGLGYVPEDRRIFTDLTVMENLEAGRQKPRAGAPSWSPEALFELFPNLAEMRQRPGGRMSGGEQQMLAIARTLMGNPSLLLLDEPSEGLAPRIVETMAKAILALKREGLTVLVSEQNLHFAGFVCERAIVLETGHLRYDGPIKALQDNAELRRAYLSV